MKITVRSRSVVENEVLYGRDYRLIDDNRDCYYPKDVCKLKTQSLWSEGRLVMRNDDL